MKHQYSEFEHPLGCTGLGCKIAETCALAGLDRKSCKTFMAPERDARTKGVCKDWKGKRVRTAPIISN